MTARLPMNRDVCSRVAQQLRQSLGLRGRDHGVGSSGADEYRRPLQVWHPIRLERYHRTQESSAPNETRPPQQETRRDVRTVRESNSNDALTVKRIGGRRALHELCQLFRAQLEIFLIEDAFTDAP